MNELERHVEKMFRHQPDTPETRELREEILSNLQAKREDLLAQGLDERAATEAAKRDIPSVDGLIDDQQPTNVERFRMACAQTVWLHCILFWIGTLPLLFTGYGWLGALGLGLSILSGVGYLLFWLLHPVMQGTRSLAGARRRKSMAWRIWGVFYAVAALSVAAMTFGSNLWYGTSVTIEGPYQWAVMASRFYVPLLTVLIPLTVSRFAALLPQCRVEG